MQHTHIFIEKPKYRTISLTNGKFQRIVLPYCVFVANRPFSMLGLAFANEYPTLDTRIYATPFDNIYLKNYTNCDCCMRYSGKGYKNIQALINQFWQEMFFSGMEQNLPLFTTNLQAITTIPWEKYTTYCVYSSFL